MTSKEADIVKKIKTRLRKVAPDARILLYGSRARGEAKQNSDWDILVILNKAEIESSDYDLISYPVYELGWQENEPLSIKLYTASDWEKRSFTPFYKNVENESISL